MTETEVQIFPISTERNFQSGEKEHAREGGSGGLKNRGHRRQHNGSSNGQKQDIPGTQLRGAQTALLALILWAYLMISSEEMLPERQQYF
jgi:hypothetical protein